MLPGRDESHSEADISSRSDDSCPGRACFSPQTLKVSGGDQRGAHQTPGERDKSKQWALHTARGRVELSVWPGEATAKRC